MKRRIGNIALVIVVAILAGSGHVNAQGRGRGNRGPVTQSPPARSNSTFRVVGIPNPLTTPGVFTNRYPGWNARRNYAFPQLYPGYYAPYIESASPVIATPTYAEPVYVPEAPRERESELAAEVQRLSGEVEQLRREQMVAPPAEPRAQQPVAKSTPSTPKVLIFRDGRRLVFYSYMVSGQALWVTDPGNSMKVSLGDLDLDAMEKENRGQGFRLVQR